jgi:hypothetical protein
MERVPISELEHLPALNWSVYQVLNWRVNVVLKWNLYPVPKSQFHPWENSCVVEFVGELSESESPLEFHYLMT